MKVEVKPHTKIKSLWVDDLEGRAPKFDHNPKEDNVFAIKHLVKNSMYSN